MKCYTSSAFKLPSGNTSSNTFPLQTPSKTSLLQPFFLATNHQLKFSHPSFVATQIILPPLPQITPQPGSSTIFFFPENFPFQGPPNKPPWLPPGVARCLSRHVSCPLRWGGTTYGFLQASGAACGGKGMLLLENGSLPSLKLTVSHLKTMDSNRNLLFQMSIFRGYVSFRECTLPKFNSEEKPLKSYRFTQ